MQRLTEVCRANGGVYVKAGQFAAAFGAVPNEYRKHLALLQVNILSLTLVLIRVSSRQPLPTNLGCCLCLHVGEVLRCMLDQQLQLL
jgi:hypothetical protein